jgi:hypothetical protein
MPFTTAAVLFKNDMALSPDAIDDPAPTDGGCCLAVDACVLKVV